jgi:hypothetical protein
MDVECGWCEEPITYDHVHDVATVGITVNGNRFQIHERCFEELFGEFGKKKSKAEMKAKWKARAMNKRVQRKARRSLPPLESLERTGDVLSRPGDRTIQDGELHRMISEHERSRPSALNQGGE